MNNFDGMPNFPLITPETLDKRPERDGIGFNVRHATNAGNGWELEYCLSTRNETPGQWERFVTVFGRDRTPGSDMKWHVLAQYGRSDEDAPLELNMKVCTVPR